MNLFNNSLDAFKQQNIKEKYLFISTKLENNNAIIYFKDNAKGINNSIISKIFKPYFTTKHKSKGTGLGLNITKKLIEKNMNGDIKAQNIEFDYNNKSFFVAMFTISIPISS